MIPVTKTFFLLISEFTQLIQRIWVIDWVTSRGKLVLELKEKLVEYLNSITGNKGRES